MTLPLWGQQEKSQDDPSTIDEAIATAIGEHNDDPESHLADGQSLSEHKHDVILDHPAGSIVPDKFSSLFSIFTVPIKDFTVDSAPTGGFWVDNSSGGIVEWDLSGAVLSGASLSVSSSSDVSELAGKGPMALFVLNYNVSFMLDMFVGVILEDGANVSSHFGIFNWNTTTPEGISFQFEEGRVRARWYRDGSLVNGDWFSLGTSDKWYHLRFSWDPATLALTFYVNASVIAQLQYESVPPTINTQNLRFYLEDYGSSFGGEAQVFSFVFYHGLPPL